MNSTTKKAVIGLVVLVLIALAVYGLRAMSADKKPPEPPAAAQTAPEEKKAQKPEEKMKIKKVDVKIPPPNLPQRFTCGKDEAIFISDKNNDGMLMYAQRSYPITLDASAGNTVYKTVDGFKPALKFTRLDNKAAVDVDGLRIDCTLVSIPETPQSKEVQQVEDAPQTDVASETQAPSIASTVQADAAIEGTLWQAVEFNGKPLAADAIITMQLADGRIAGKSGCNRYTGPYSTDLESRSLQVTGPVAGTRMACAPAAMEVEAAFNDMLPKITAYRVDAGPVLVVFAGTEDVMHLKPAQTE